MGVTQNVAVTFDNIAINDCYELVNGKIELVVDPNKQLLDVDAVEEAIAKIELKNLDELINRAIDRLDVYSGSQNDVDEFAKIYSDIEKIRAKIQASTELPQELKTLYLQEIDKALANIQCVATAAPSSTPNGRIAATTSGCSVASIKNALSEVSKALVNPWGYILSKGGACLKGFALDLAGQYIVSYAVRSMMGQPSDFATIYREDISIMSATAACGNSVLESIRGKCDVCDAVVSVIVGMADDIQKQYNEGTPIEKINYVRTLQAGAYSALGEVVGKYVVAPLTTAVAKHGAVLVRKAFEDKLKVPKPVCDVIFSGSLCFVAGTPIRMADGNYRPIESIKAGDLVWSRDEFTKQEAAQRVQKPFSNTARRLVKIIAGIDTIFTTPEHPFYVENKGMTQAQLLHKGDLLSTVTPTEASLALLPHLARSGITVENIHLLDTTVAVYNFEVSDFHTYFVGNQSIWVHNANCGPTLIKKAANGGLFDELEITTFKTARLVSKDFMTGHHIPSQKFMTSLKSKPEYMTDPNFKKMVDDYNPDQAFVIMMEETVQGQNKSRHGKTLTYGGYSRNPGYLSMSPKQALNLDIDNLRDIYRQEGLYTDEVAKQIDLFKNKVLQQYPHIFKY